MLRKLREIRNRRWLRKRIKEMEAETVKLQTEAMVILTRKNARECQENARLPLRAIAFEDLSPGDHVTIDHNGKAVKADASKWHWCLFTVKKAVSRGEVFSFD